MIILNQVNNGCIFFRDLSRFWTFADDLFWAKETGSEQMETILIFISDSEFWLDIYLIIRIFYPSVLFLPGLLWESFKGRWEFCIFGVEKCFKKSTTAYKHRKWFCQSDKTELKSLTVAGLKKWFFSFNGPFCSTFPRVTY